MWRAAAKAASTQCKQCMTGAAHHAVRAHRAACGSNAAAGGCRKDAADFVAGARTASRLRFQNRRFMITSTDQSLQRMSAAASDSMAHTACVWYVRAALRQEVPSQRAHRPSQQANVRGASKQLCGRYGAQPACAWLLPVAHVRASQAEQLHRRHAQTRSRCEPASALRTTSAARSLSPADETVERRNKICATCAVEAPKMALGSPSPY
jgi:hypothetical protein